MVISVISMELWNAILIRHSLAVFEPRKFDRSSTRQDEGCKITDEILRFLFGACTKFSGDLRMFSEYCCVYCGIE